MAKDKKQFTITSKVVFGDKSYGPGQEEELAADRPDSLTYLAEQGAIKGYAGATKEEAEAPKPAAKKGGK